MIFDSITSASLYAQQNPLFKKAFDFIQNTDFNKLDFGKHNIVGDDLYVGYMEYESKDVTECMMENHKKYIDIQYIVSGEEFIGVTTSNKQTPSVAYDDAKDVAFYKEGYDSLLKMDQGKFAIFYPQDLHMPCIKIQQASKVRKAVFKIRVM